MNSFAFMIMLACAATMPVLADAARPSLFEPSIYNDVAIYTISGHAYAAVTSFFDDSLQIVNITDPARPVPIGGISVDQPGHIRTGPNGVEILSISGHTYAAVTSFFDDSLQIVNITDPARPVPIGGISVDQPGHIRTGPNGVEILSISGHTYAAVTNHYYGGVQIVNITDPARPAPVSSIINDQDGFDALDGSSGVATVDISGRAYAVVTSFRDNGMQIVNITDPARPAPVSSIFEGRNGFDALHRPFGVATAAISERTYAVVIGEPNDMQIVDITDPAHPVPAGSIGGQGPSRNAVGLTGITIVDISGSTYAVTVGLLDDVMQIVNITDPAHPVRVGSIFDGQKGLSLNMPGGVDVATISKRTYAVMAINTDDGIQIVDITDTASPVPTHDGKGEFDKLEWPSAAAATTISGRHYAVVTNYVDDAVRVVDITDPTLPRLTSTAFYYHLNSTGDGPTDIAITDISGRQYAILTSYRNDAVRIFDITDPVRPRLAGSIFDGRDGFNALDWPTGVSLATMHGSTYAVVTSIDDSIQIINITDPARPAPAGSIFGGRNGFDAMHRPVDVATTTISGRTYAIVVGEGGSNTQIIDVTDPERSILASSISGDQNRTGMANRPAGVAITAVSGNVYAVVTDHGDGAVRIMDVTDPERPILAGSILDGEDTLDAPHKPVDVATTAIHGRVYAVVADGEGAGGWVFDITDPARPLPTGILGGQEDPALYGADGITTHAMSGNAYAIMTSYAGAGTQIINITDTAYPAPIATIPDGQYGDYLDQPDGIATYAMSGHHYAAILNGYDGVDIVNITDPAHPSLISNISGDWEGELYALWPIGVATAVISGHVYAVITDYEEGAVRIFNVTDPAHPALAGSALDGRGGFDLSSPIGVATAVISGHTYAVVTCDFDGNVQIINITDPARPAPVSNIFYNQSSAGVTDMPNDVAITAISGNVYAVITGYRGDTVRVFDITDPARPILISDMSDGQDGFDALNRPNEIGITKVSGNTYAVITGYSGDAVQIADITDPARPVPVSSVFDGRGGFDALSWPAGVAITAMSGNVYAVVVSNWDNGMQVIDITDPARPVPVSSVFDYQDGFGALDKPNNIAITAISGSTYAIVSSVIHDAVLIVDITDPARPVPAAAYSWDHK